MGRKGENIHKRKDGRWEARILIQHTGEKKRYHSVYGKTYKEVKEKKAFYIENTKKISISDTQMTLRELLNIWMDNRLFYQKESTRLKYQTLIETHINPVLGDMDINYIDDITINKFLTQKKESGRLDRKGGLSNSYIKSMAIIISSAMCYAAEKEYRPPLKAKIMKPSTERKEIHTLSESEQNLLEESLSNDTSPTSLGILIALNAGLRIGEICALKWEDIDMKNRIIFVKSSVVRISAMGESKQKTQFILSEPKTHTSIRAIPITTKLFSILEKASPTSIFVVSHTPNFVSPRTFEYRFHKMLARYCIPDINFHTLRHTFATRCVEKNVDIKTLSEILGHSDVSITLNYYVHPSFDTKRHQLEKICF